MFKSKSSGSKRTRKYKLIYYLPELLTICYLVAYGVAEHNYYSNPMMAELAREGFTTRGYWTGDNRHDIIIPNDIIIPTEQSMEAFKPWKLPERFPPLSSGLEFHFTHVERRPLTFIETDLGGALLGLVPVGLKYSIVAISRYRKAR